MTTNDRPDLVQGHLSELAQHVLHVIQACNEEKDLLEGEFDSVRPNIEILVIRLRTEKERIDSEVSGVGSHMILQQAVCKK